MEKAKVVPLLKRAELEAEIRQIPGMSKDPALQARAMRYLEQIGEVMVDDRVDSVVLDPLGWFASLLACFICDDRPCRRGMEDGYCTELTVRAILQEKYKEPNESVPAVMSLLCKLAPRLGRSASPPLGTYSHACYQRQALGSCGGSGSKGSRNGLSQYSGGIGSPVAFYRLGWWHCCCCGSLDGSLGWWMPNDGNLALFLSSASEYRCY